MYSKNSSRRVLFEKNRNVLKLVNNALMPPQLIPNFCSIEIPGAYQCNFELHVCGSPNSPLSLF